MALRLFAGALCGLLFAPIASAQMPARIYDAMMPEPDMSKLYTEAFLPAN
jgi:hypothetical protein